MRGAPASVGAPRELASRWPVVVRAWPPRCGWAGLEPILDMHLVLLRRALAVHTREATAPAGRFDPRLAIYNGSRSGRFRAVLSRRAASAIFELRKPGRDQSMLRAFEALRLV